MSGVGVGGVRVRGVGDVGLERSQGSLWYLGGVGVERVSEGVGVERVSEECLEVYGWGCLDQGIGWLNAARNDRNR